MARKVEPRTSPSKKAASEDESSKTSARKTTSRKGTARAPAAKASIAKPLTEKTVKTPARKKASSKKLAPKVKAQTVEKQSKGASAVKKPSRKVAAARTPSRRAAIEEDELALEAHNRRYYDAFQELNLTRLGQLWWRDETATCAHPGWDLRYGWPAVRQTYREIFRSTRSIRFSLGNVRVRVVGDLGYVTCIENLVSEERDSGDYLGAVLATNVFERRNNEWRLVHHHASPFSVEELFIPEGPLH